MKYLIILALLGFIGCGINSPYGCEEEVETVKADPECNEEEDFCTFIETTTKTCKELDLGIIEDLIERNK